MTSDRPLRWLRIAAIATGAIILASCRSLTVPALLPATALTIVADDADDADAPSACRPCRGCVARPAACRSGGCPAEACPAPVCLPPPEVPTAVPCLVCDGGDHGAPARPTGRHGLRNLTAGDTVARYRPADVPLDDDDDLSEVRLAASTCACVYAPRFSSVRQVIRPNEETAPIGPRGLANEAHVDAAVDTLPVVARRQKVCLGQARVAQFGLAVEERLPALAVDQADLPEASINADMPVERVRDEHPALASRVQTPRIKVGFDVPVAWTCVRGAQVIVDGRSAEVIAADRGTATLRLEEPGRAELTLCKRAGSDTARVGEELDFTIFLLNSGDRALTDITLVDAIPKRLTLVPDSAASSLPAEISTGAGDDGSVVVTWRLTGTLPPGEGGFVRFRTIVR